jgi:hypothetical protein
LELKLFEISLLLNELKFEKATVVKDVIENITGNNRVDKSFRGFL